MVILFIVCASVFFNAKQTFIDPAPEISLDIHRQFIEAGSPLLVKTAFKNNSLAPIELKQRFGNEYGTLLFHIKMPNSIDWKMISTVESGTLSSLNGGIVLNPQETIASYTLFLLNNRSEFIFDRPGEYQLKAQVRTKTEVFWSEPLNITVKEPDMRLAKVMQRLGRKIDPEKEAKDPELENFRSQMMHLSLEGGGMTKPGALDKLRAQLGGLNDFDHVFSFGEAIRNAGSRDVQIRDKGLEELERLGKEEPGLWKEIASDCLPYYYAHAGKYSKADQLLKNISHSTTWTTRAKNLIKSDKTATSPAVTQ